MPNCTITDTLADGSVSISATAVTMTVHAPVEITTTKSNQVTWAVPLQSIGTLNSDTPGMTLGYSYQTSTSTTDGLSVTLTGDLESYLKLAIGYTHTVTTSTAVTSTAGGTIPANNPPGVLWGMYGSPESLDSEGTYKAYDANGFVSSGDWSWIRPLTNAQDFQQWYVTMQKVSN